MTPNPNDQAQMDLANSCDAGRDITCGEWLPGHKPCQCDELCLSVGDCCKDYVATCKATTPTPTSR